MGPLASKGIPTHIQVLTGALFVVFLRRKATSRRDRSNGPNNYTDQLLRIWSQSPADPCWVPTRELGPHSDQPIISSPSAMFRPTRKNVAQLSASDSSKKTLEGKRL
jgi:hypothetical protein